MPRPRDQRGEADAPGLVGLLDPGGPQVLQNHLGEGLFMEVIGTAFVGGINQFIVFIDAEDAVRGEAFDGEGTGDTNLLFVLVRFVVEVFELGLGGDGGIDFPLPGDAGLPPGGVEFPRCLGPFGVGFAGNFPLLPTTFHGGVQLFAQRFQGLLPCLPDDVDFGIVGDGFESDMGDTLVNKAVADVVLESKPLRSKRGTVGLGLFFRAIWTIGKEVKRVASTHDAGSGQGQSDAGGVNGNPTAAPFFTHRRTCARSTGRVEDKVTGIGRHQQTSFVNFYARLDDINLGVRTILNRSGDIEP